MKTATISLFLLVVMVFSVSASTEGLFDEYAETQPWEQGDPVPTWVDVEPDLTEPHGMLQGLALSLVRFYQRNISVKSASRCPYHISCSHYAALAIERKGLFLGLCYFVDRHYYRENRGMHLHYEYRETESGVLRLDDSFFILGK